MKKNIGVFLLVVFLSCTVEHEPAALPVSVKEGFALDGYDAVGYLNNQKQKRVA